MNIPRRIALAAFPVFVAAGLLPSAALAQNPVPVIVPIAVDTAVPIVVNTIKPKPKAGVEKFEGFVMNSNLAQITVRAKGNDLAIRTFPLSEAASAKMQKIVDKGGYQFGDKVTILYDGASQKALRVKGKPSRPL